MTIREAISLGREKLSQNSIERPLLEAEILMSYYIGLDRVSLMINDNKEIDDILGYLHLIDRRCKSEPIEYITSKAGFYGRDFTVYPGVLIPRPETEILIDKASELVKRYNITSIAEVGIGSGIISIILALKFPNIKIVATDISKIALKNAKDNIKRFGLEDKITLYHCSMLDCIDSKIELLVSNPPYISYDFELDSCVKDYEPHTALFAKDNGYSILKSLVDIAVDKNIPFIACEMGYNQKEHMSRYLDSKGIREYQFYKDYANLDRGFVAKVAKI